MYKLCYQFDTIRCIIIYNGANYKYLIWGIEDATSKTKKYKNQRYPDAHYFCNGTGLQNKLLFKRKEYLYNHNDYMFCGYGNFG